MPQLRTFELIALSAAAFDAGDFQKCSDLFVEALNAPDRKEGVQVLSSYGTAPEDVKGSDVGVVVTKPGDQLRVSPDENQKRQSQEDDEPEQAPAQDATVPEVIPQPVVELRALTPMQASALSKRFAARRAARAYFGEKK